MRRLYRRIAAVVVVVASLAVASAAEAAPWQRGDLALGVSGGMYNVVRPDGTIVDTLNDGLGGFTTGCAFAAGKLYTTDFSQSKIIVYDQSDPHSIVQTIDTGAAGGASNESIAFDNSGAFYVGNAGTNVILKYNSDGSLNTSYTVAIEDRGTDWVDLAADQSTIYYTSEGTTIFRYDTATNTQLTLFAAGLPGSVAYALRILPDGSVLVADTEQILHLDASGNVIKTYDIAGDDGWFSLNLDPNGTSFWAGDFSTGQYAEFNIASGASEAGPITAAGPNQLFGICLLGEVTAGRDELVLSKTADASTAAPGAGDGYTISVQNPQDHDVVLGSLTDHLPTDFSYVAGSSSGLTTSDPAVNGQDLTWTGPFTIAAGSTATLHFNVTVANTAGDYFNDVDGAAPNADVVPADHTAEITVEGGTPQPLTISKSADESVACGGSTDGYTITLGNPNSFDVSVAYIRDKLNKGFTYVPGSSSGLTTSDPTISSRNRILRWDGPFTIPAGATATLHFNINVGHIIGTHKDRAKSVFAEAIGGFTFVHTGGTAPIRVRRKGC